MYHYTGTLIYLTWLKRQGGEDAGLDGWMRVGGYMLDEMLN
jgi:hypothetical protein